jgi:hypothetical protein
MAEKIPLCDPTDRARGLLVIATSWRSWFSTKDTFQGKEKEHCHKGTGGQGH